MTGDWHIHSCFSNDSETPLDVIAAKALEKGLSDICITDHTDIDLKEDGWVQDIPSYAEGLEAFKEKYKGILNVHIGLEVGLNPDYKEEIEKHVASYPFEFVLGSTHTMQGNDPYYRTRYDMPDDEFFRIYFERCLENIKAFDCYDCCAHLDYVVRYGYEKDKYYSYEKYREPIDEILEILVKRGTALEVNTAGLRKGLKYVHPYPEILKTYKKMGGRKISIGSDAHRPGDVGADISVAVKELYELGFTEEDINPVYWLKK